MPNPHLQIRANPKAIQAISPPRDKNDDLEAVDIGTSTISARSLPFASGNSVNDKLLESNPTGNGDITSILRILPNVQFNNNQFASTTPGEIDPANISISGGVFYQNNFQIDGLNINNDLDPNGGTTNNINTLRGGRNQGFAIDTSLLESITVQDSNVSASFGRFTGGVVEAVVRKPRSDGWHTNLSYQFTSDALTRYHISDDTISENSFNNSADENYQPKFHKHIFRTNLEGYITKDLGIIASFNTTQSFIPLNAYQYYATASGTGRYQGANIGDSRTQKRQSYNVYAKLNYNVSDYLTMEAYLGYMPQENTYFIKNVKDSYYSMDSGGWQSGIKTSWENSLGFWLNSLGYTRMENSRRSDKNYYISWYASSDKNWGYSTSSYRAIEGGYGDLDTLQDTVTLKSDFNFHPIFIDIWQHLFRIGTEINYYAVERNRLESVYFASNLPQNTNGTSCYEGDQFGIGQSFCSNNNGILGGSRASWSGQYFNSLQVYHKGKTRLDSIAYGFYIEDDINLYLGKVGNLKSRVGLRLDGDNYMEQITLAPRFSLSFVSPAQKEWQSELTFGANRYYGRNLFSYRLYDNDQNLKSNYLRTSASAPFTLTTSDNNSTYLFSKLRVPYDDELMVAFRQDLSLFSLTLKYIHRKGRDEIMRRSRSTTSNNLPAISGYSNNYTIWTNDGQSESNIISAILQNIKPLETFGISHYYLLAFDYTNTKRTYNLLASDETYYNDSLIYYDGKIIPYRDRPVENYTRPWTLRLNTTHSFELGHTKWLWNNFFRYRAGYDKMVRLTATTAGYNSAIGSTYTQYGKYHFKGAFSWDMRVGFELKTGYKNDIVYFNVDIYNVLNSRNKATMSDTATSGSTNGSAFATSASTIIYELGRQFWLQIGYKF